jgi:hypothetical protein
MTGPSPTAAQHATNSFVESLERKWAKEAADKLRAAVIERRARVSAPLEPVEARRQSSCGLCRSSIEPGEGIVTADGLEWVHAACAALFGWDVE